MELSKPSQSAVSPASTAKASNNLLAKAELLFAILLSAFALGLHISRLSNAGALWRDEAAAVQLATMPHLSEVVRFFPHEAFPLMFPAIVRLWSGLFGNSDMAFRIFGFLIGSGIVGVLWWLGLRVWRTIPLLSLALLGFNSAFLEWGDSVRAYGLGTLLLLGTIGLVWRMMEKPSVGNILAAAVCAVASVQCLFQNAIFVFAVCVGAAGAGFWRRSRKAIALPLIPGLAAALSLLPYWKPLRNAAAWDKLIHLEFSFHDFSLQIARAFSSSGGWSISIWVVLLLSAVTLTAMACFKPSALGVNEKQREMVMFAGVTVFVGIAGYCIFLKSLSHPVRAWHLVVMIGFAAALMDVILQPLRQWQATRAAQIGLALLTSAFCFVPAWRVAQMRQTNIDVVASTLRQIAGPDDLIVVTPWYNGISFQRYFKGPTAWTTAPSLGFNLFHRYDLIKSLMATNQQGVSQPVIVQMENCFRAGHRVWLVGEGRFASPDLKIRTMPPAPSKPFGWHEQPYTMTWTLEAELYLRTRSARIAEVSVPSDGPVNPFESLWVKGFEAEAKP